MKYVLTLLFILISQNSFAGCEGTGCIDVKIEMLYVDITKTYIKTDGVETNLDNCTPDSSVYVALDHSHPSADKIYALLLTAYTSKMNVQMRFYGGIGDTGLCTIQYAILANN